jgi:hypothetical protein
MSESVLHVRHAVGSCAQTGFTIAKVLLNVGVHFSPASSLTPAAGSLFASRNEQ